MKRLLSRLAVAVVLSLAVGLSSACLVPVGAGVEVALGPPPLRAEVAVTAPGPEVVWVPGFWDWQGAAWVWTPGAWMRPPHPRAVWVRPAYHSRRGHWYYVRGHWR